MWKKRISALILIILALVIGRFIWTSEVNKTNYAFKLGLDLKGGTHLVYEADTRFTKKYGSFGSNNQ
jgi:preprotein translocase subunit SecD